MSVSEMELEVFRAGDYGDKGCWSEADLAQIAADYDPATHEAPVTIDHAQSGPAWGWVRGLRAAGPMLLATLGQMSDDLKSLLSGGRYKKRSIELYPALPATGRPYLRAVSFLGAAAPEVKGLADPLFADEAGNSLRLPFDEEVHPASSKASSSQSTVSTPPNLSTPPPTSIPAFADAERLRGQVERLEREAARREIDGVCRSLEREGRLLPAWREAGIIPFMESLRAADNDSMLNRSTLNQFSEPVESSNSENSPYRWFVRFLQSLPPMIPMGEAAPLFSAAFEPAPPPPGVPMSARVNPASLERHRRALALLTAAPALTYSEALLKVSAARE